MYFTYRQNDGKRVTGRVHSMMCEAFHGPRPPKMQARHLNGNNQDNRPANLCWGTPRENYDDRDAHGTTARGERQGLAKLSELEVRQIRGLLVHGLPQREIATEFRVSEGTVSDIGHWRTWAHLPNDYPGWVYREGCDDTQGEHNGNARLSEDEVREIRQLSEQGVPQRAIADEFGVSQSIVSKIKRGTAWAHVTG
jgi:DNA-directed RNA polymerase specialized sigma24 family protein